MKIIRFKLLLIALPLFASTYPTNALAQLPPILISGAPPATPTGTFENVPVPFKFRMAGNPNSSYCCTALASNGDARFDGVEDLLFEINPDPEFAYRGDYPPAILGTDGGGPQVEGRVCVFSPFASFFEFTIDSDEPVATFETLRVACEETSLVGVFNTSVSEFNFLEVTNHSLSTVTVKVRGFSETTGGQQVIDLQFTMEPQIPPRAQRRDFDIHSLVGPGAFGAMEVTHNGTPESISVRLSQYDVLSTSPLDFRLVQQTEFKRRGR